ncbi:TetR/AcrR family transcriptional regulator [Actinoalloteichus hymeniacidonis]|uniref:Transcriptional regulator, TetR family n=1 Tax=Actinoalloteichus hymeniacidonis TaxID=340345 RepID=A0AAC9HML1_9PSEU|nr:TetR/AcrR family transcriptional regulator [Actinoalloteichus hymeniacidonis]AOS62018.1 transcriptional regulator, TetR family [Actinoalloteichus hymeniacidonis]MBB5909960.1 AcrR family transcriptional regulator [Actinoalloteichus hymeniacidonis]
MADARALGLRADAARNYERIVVAAGQAFEEVGPAVTLEQVARQAGVGVATVYRRFRNRDQLVRAVVEHVITTEIQPVDIVASDDPWQDLTDFLNRSLDALTGRRVMIALARETDAIGPEAFAPFLRWMDELAGRLVDAGLVRPELVGQDLGAVIIMVLAMTQVRGESDSPARRRYLALLLDGLRPTSNVLPGVPLEPIMPC